MSTLEDETNPDTATAPTEASPNSTEAEPVTISHVCSFCEKTHDPEGRELMITGLGDAAICEDCVKLTQVILNERYRHAALTKRKRLYDKYHLRKDVLEAQMKEKLAPLLAELHEYEKLHGLENL